MRKGTRFIGYPAASTEPDFVPQKPITLKKVLGVYILLVGGALASLFLASIIF